MITRTGAAVLAGSLVLALLAWTFASTALAALAGCGALAVAAGRLVLHTTPRIATAPRTPTRQIPRGEPLTATIPVPAVRRRWLPRPTVLVTCSRQPALGAPDGRADTVVAGTVADSAEGAEYHLPLPTDRHGPLVVGPTLVRRSDPLFLFRSDTAVGTPLTVQVLPRVLRVPAAPSRDVTGRDGAARRPGPLGAWELHSLHAYRPGDDVRRIHWPSSARGDTPLVRRDLQPDEHLRHLWLDTHPDAYSTGADFEEAVDTTASLAVDALRRGLAVRLWTSAGRFVHGDSPPGGVTQVLRFLTAVVPTASVGPPGAGRPGRLRSGGPSVESLTVVTGDAPAVSLPSLSARRGRLLVLRLGTARRTPGRSPGRRTTGVADRGTVRYAADAEQALALWSAAFGSGVGRWR
ncbi:DUF58 domain-containing protein [Streptomyces coffeae]|uniref:DUF58 domain-containing protein n=1 Tax=Streptomyces coffeae TaxID=621382 RepID=A0ABS1NJP1_9ACTN|nr:DUF58 domain-containing protein [Streptomyces coffeae]MBL1100293.1 DUF58 domain-containing protein [Streptomyces coffeae]